MIGIFRSVVPDIRQFIIANRNSLLELIGWINGQIKFHDTIAACKSMEVVHIMSADVQGFSRKHIGKLRVIVAKRDYERLMIVRKNRQMQCVIAVTAIYSLMIVVEDIGIGLHFLKIYIMSVPHISLIGTDCVLLNNMVNRVNRQGEIYCAVAAKGGRHHLLIGKEAVRFRGHIKAVGHIAFTLTDFSIQVGGGKLMDDKIQDHDTIASIGSDQILGVESRYSLIESVLRIGCSFTDVSHDSIAVLGCHR